MSKADFLSDPKNRAKTVKKFKATLVELKVDYLVAAQPRDISLAAMIAHETKLPLSYLDNDGTLTGESALWKSKSPALILDGIEDIGLVDKTVNEVKAGNGSMKYGLVNGKQSDSVMGELRTLGLTWRVVS